MLRPERVPFHLADLDEAAWHELPSGRIGVCRLPE
jgi:hypothetical protein